MSESFTNWEKAWGGYHRRFPVDNVPGETDGFRVLRDEWDMQSVPPRQTILEWVVREGHEHRFVPFPARRDWEARMIFCERCGEARVIESSAAASPIQEVRT